MTKEQDLFDLMSAEGFARVLFSVCQCESAAGRVNAAPH